MNQSTRSAIEAAMQAAGVPELPTRIFWRHVRQLAEQPEAAIRERDIAPVTELPDLDRLPAELEAIGSQTLGQAAVLKLNGGLGTSMGLAGPKSLLPVREGRSFLDLIVAQTRLSGVPLLLMNSFATEAETQRRLEQFRQAGDDHFHTFLQHQVPKLRADDLSPIQWQPEQLAWCPPGHGDLYAAMVTSGTLDRLRRSGRRYLFVSNADNLGATLDLRLLGYMVREECSFLMEVADRTDADRKGGHLACRGDGTLLLREGAQCHADDLEAFQDVRRHRYFNTNNLWIDLEQLAVELERYAGDLPLSLIVNRKTVDPADPQSPAVYQLETAMGAAISLMPRSAAVRVPRSRFAPVKTTSDLLAVRSDAYMLNEHWAVQLIEERAGVPPVLQLDSHCYRTVDALDRLVSQPPSLRRCDRLVVEGPVMLGPGVEIVGEVELVNRSGGPVALSPGQYRGRHELG